MLIDELECEWAGLRCFLGFFIYYFLKVEENIEFIGGT